VTRLRTWRLRFPLSIPGRVKRYFSSWKRPDRLWNPFTLLFNGCRGFWSTEYSSLGMRLRSHSFLDKVKNDWSYTYIFPYQFMAYTEYFLSFFLYENKLFQFTFTTNKWGKLHILIYIQQDATLHSLFYLETLLHVSGGTSTHRQELIQLYLQHLVFVTPFLLPAAIVDELELVW